MPHKGQNQLDCTLFISAFCTVTMPLRACVIQQNLDLGSSREGILSPGYPNLSLQWQEIALMRLL